MEVTALRIKLCEYSITLYYKLSAEVFHLSESIVLTSFFSFVSLVMIVMIALCEHDQEVSKYQSSLKTFTIYQDMFLLLIAVVL